MDDFKACINCKNLILIEGGKQWHHRRCGVICHERARDPYDGEWKYGLKNDLGKLVIVDEPNPCVRDINTDGKCCLFERKP